MSPPRVPGRILIKPAAGVPEKLLQWELSRHGARQVGAIGQIDVRLLQVPEKWLGQALGGLRRNPRIAFAELDDLLAPAFLPDDTYYSLAWHLPKIAAPDAWEITTGNSAVIIAILDSGVDPTHPDLAPLLVPGWNFYDNSPDTTDVTGHGTPVAGAAAAAGNNGQGVAGIAWGCRIMPVRICDANGYASLSTIASGLTWAADQGARVANISFRASSGSTITSAAQYFQARGGVVTVSAGNNAIFDSSADNPYLLTVGGTDSDDALASFSNTGNNIDLAAPGVNIMTTATGGDYGSGTGTSFSAPVVAGVAALAISANPNLTGSQTQQILLESVDDLGAPGWDTSFGWGRVNAFNAVHAAAAAPGGDTVAPVASVTAPAPGAIVSGVVGVTVDGTDNIGVTRVDLYVNEALTGTSATATAGFAWDTTALVNGSYTLTVRAYDGAGNVGTSAAVTVLVQNAVADTTPPAVQITSPSNGTRVGKSVRVTVAANDNVGVVKVQLLIDGKLYGTSTEANAAFTWNTSKLARGSSHFLQAVGFDAAGNSTRSSAVTVYK
jgi:subtilisin family serine protease